eukprot:SAG11_NODE_12733_length_688_cov_0.993209_1_plen_123_part_00
MRKRSTWKEEAEEEEAEEEEEEEEEEEQQQEEEFATRTLCGHSGVPPSALGGRAQGGGAGSGPCRRGSRPAPAGRRAHPAGRCVAAPRRLKGYKAAALPETRGVKKSWGARTTLPNTLSQRS